MKARYKFEVWEAAIDAVEGITQDSQALIDPQIVTNTRDLISVCQSRCRAPESAGKGYWNTIILSWSGLDIEVFEDHFELYSFKDQKTDIRHFERPAGTSIPWKLLDVMAQALNARL